MITIKISSNNIQEKKYIIDIIFYEFLGLNYKLEINENIKNYEIILQNGNRLIIEDSFFNLYPKDLEYLKLENIPKKVEFIKNDFIVENNLPVIYGNDKISVSEKEIICGVDVFASSFFMLTRWEEYVNKNRDNHNRFPAYESLAYKQGFLNRPIVNEYVEMLWNMFKYLGIKQNRKKREFKLILTHDVDEIYMWKSWKQVFRVAMGDIIKRRNFLLALDRIAEYFLIKRGKIKDPYDTFEWLMDKSETVGVKSRFYFMSGGVTNFDNRYKINDKRVIKLIEKIKKRGHIIGFHASYNSYNNLEQFKKEKKLLEKVSNQKIIEGRQHYLRFEVPITWQIWEDNEMKIDSTCGYADREGFRCGTGDEYSVFNILTRQKLKLRERPLIFMDDNHYSYNKNISYNKSFDIINELITQSKKYNSYITILFHNSIFTKGKNIDFENLYQNLLELK